MSVVAIGLVRFVLARFRLLKNVLRKEGLPRDLYDHWCGLC